MKIYLSKINESWIVDRVRKEWYENNKKISTNSIKKSDLIWIISPWIWKKISKKQLIEKKVICSYYHFDFDKFGNEERNNFYELDKFVNEYHVISKKTQKQLETLTDKKITSIPFWLNQNIWFPLPDKNKLKKELGFSERDYLVGSFQRDTEGKDLISPKLVKGPDIFLDIVTDILNTNQNLKVILTGKRRGYLIDNFEKRGIPYKYFEMANFSKLNSLYNILDLYVVSSRVEGGPQAILEAAATKTPIISTDVGVASEILHKKAIFKNNYKEASPMTDYAFQNVEKFKIPSGFDNFISMLSKVK